MVKKKMPLARVKLLTAFQDFTDLIFVRSRLDCDMRKFRLPGNKEKCHASGSEQNRADGVLDQHQSALAHAVWNALAFAAKRFQSVV
jgi:hypothetical protein